MCVRLCVYVFVFGVSKKGSPGDLIADRTTLPVDGLDNGNFIIPLDPPVVLSSGTYW